MRLIIRKKNARLNPERIPVRAVNMNIKKFNILFAWCLVFGYASVIFYFSSLSHPLSREVASYDKILHAIEYFFFAILIFRAFETLDFKLSRKFIIVIAVTSATFYGLTDEIHQSFTPSRSMSAFDLLFDFFGSILGVMVYNKIKYGNNKIV